MPQARAIRAGFTRWLPACPLATPRTTGLTALATAAMLLPGCLPETKPGFYSPAPSKRLDAIVDASRLDDDESLVRLVEKLRSFAPAERMFAIRSLEIRTGETLGYNHAAEHWQRIAAYNRWLDWLESEGIQIPDTLTRQPEQPSDQEGSSEGFDDEQPMEMERIED